MEAVSFMQTIIPWLFSVHGGHSKEFCDHADSFIEEIIHRAIELGMPVYGISEHAPRNHTKYLYPEEIDMNWTPEVLMNKFYSYCKTVEKLQDKYMSQITLLKGLEIEVVPPDDYVSFTQELVHKGNIEYIIGSVHWVNGYMIDYSRDKFNEAVKAHYGLENLVVAYYQTLKDMVKSIKPDIVAHFDLITCFLEPEEIPAYTHPQINAIEQALEEIKSNNCLLELNTSGLRKPINRIFPDKFIIKKSNELKIPFTFGDDSHNIQQVGYRLQLARQTLIDLGITEVTRLNKSQQNNSKIIREQISLI